MGKRTLILSVDPAHSLADAFDLGGALFHGNTADPLPVGERLFLQEVNINHEVKLHWKEISGYIASVLRTTGIQGVAAEEMAIFPGMEELSAMMYVNSYRRGTAYDVIILDCAPTAESLRFVSLPTTLGWYMKHIFSFQRNVLKALRPLANRLAPVELPPDSYFRNIQDLFHKVDGMDKVLEDASVTSVRLVTNPEKMVLRETQRAFVYFTMHGLSVDGIIANRVLPPEAEGTFFDGWRRSQQEVLKEIEQYFSPVPVRQVPLFSQEVLGPARLEELAARLYAPDEDPSAISRNEPPFQFVKSGDGYEVRITMPFAEKAEIGLFKKQDELVVEVGTVRRHIGLPTSMAALQPVKAKLDGSVLVVDMRETL
jgi:arsenite-transporting ATPase